MQDMETGSLWAQVLGESIMGDMENSKLTLFPSSRTTFEEFKRLYPNGILLKKDGRGLPNSPYENYFRDRTKLGIFGRVDNFRRLKGKEMVVGVRYNGVQVAVTRKVLRKKGFCVIKELHPPVILTYNDSTESISAFRYSIPGAKLEFELKGNLIQLKKSDNSWNLFTGKIATGNAKDLELAPFTTSYWFAWSSFFPETKLIK